MRALVAILLLVSCGHAPTPVCVSRAGLIVDSAPLGWCDQLQDAEDRFLNASKEIAASDPRFNSAGARLAGWHIIARNVDSWKLDNGLAVAGITGCDEKLVEVDRADPNLIDSSFGHELCHVVQSCQPLPPFIEDGNIQDYYHSNWGPIYRALARAFK